MARKRTARGDGLPRVLCAALLCVPLVGCFRAGHYKAGQTPDGAPMWRVECRFAEDCDREAAKACKGEPYTTMQEGEAYREEKNFYTGEKSTATNRRTLIACVTPTEPEPIIDPQKQRADAIVAAEPLGAPADKRCEYYRHHLDVTADTPSTKRVRAWLVSRVELVCAEVADTTADDEDNGGEN